MITTEEIEEALTIRKGLRKVYAMTGFTKLWAEILTSSIWNEDDKTRILWITMLAAKGPDHIVRASVGGLAHLARMSKEDCAAALKVLESPDEDSRSKENEGRRIERIDGGFLILNGIKYREAQNDEDRRKYMAEYMRDYRKRSKVNVNKSNDQLTQSESDAEGESDSNKNPEGAGIPPQATESSAMDFDLGNSTLRDKPAQPESGPQPPHSARPPSPKLRPNRSDFDAYLDEHCPTILDKDPDLYLEWDANNFHLWKGTYWEPIYDWRKTLEGLESKMWTDKTGKKLLSR